MHENDKSHLNRTRIAHKNFAAFVDRAYNNGLDVYRVEIDDQTQADKQ